MISLKFNKKIYDPNDSDLPHPNIAASYHTIAGVYLARGKYDEALKYFHKGLKIAKMLYPEGDYTRDLIFVAK